MNISAFEQNGNVFVNCECIKGISFKNADLWENCALLSVICAVFGRLEDVYAHFSRVENLLPHICLA